MKFLNKMFLTLAACLVLSACDDSNEPDPTPEGDDFPLVEDGTSTLLVLCSGMWNQNNSSLFRYSFETGTSVSDYFLAENGRGLGDTANDMGIYGSKIYIVVNESNTVEIVDRTTGKSLKQLSMVDDENGARQPRSVAFYKNKAYVCSFDGTVARIDTTSLNIDGWITCGRNPDDLCVQDGKLYVANSGGLDYMEPIGVDRTVSVVDLNTFSEIKKIEVGPNPGKILPGPGHSVYVVTRGALSTAEDYHLVKIDTSADVCAEIYDVHPENFAIYENRAYLYRYDYTTSESEIAVFNLESGQMEREDFITDGTKINTPSSIEVNPVSGNVYITDANAYMASSDILSFSPEGTLNGRLDRIGVSAICIAFE